MSRFFNLESYIEYCQYAQIFVDNINLNHKNKQDLLLEYKHFIDRNKKIEFLEFPSLPSLLTSQLTPSHQSRISKQKLGFVIEDNREEEIFIIPPINAFGLSLLRASYLFSPVFYYWNFVDDIIQFDNLLNKPLIIYNFDNFTPSQIIPLTFESHPKINYPIPIIDTRNLDNYQSLKLSFMYEEGCDRTFGKYFDRIFSTITNNIIEKLKLDISLKKDLIKYLQKINILQLINSQQEKNITSFPIIIYLEDKFYHYLLNVEEIKKILSQELPLQELNNIIKNNQDKYNFLVISSYDLPLVNTSLSSNVISVKTDDFAKFKQIWLEAKNNEFPLYGQHLDKISFFIKGKEKNQDREISLPERICYQGQKEEKIYGEYSNDNKELKQEFTMSTPSVYLPFTINGESLIDEETSKEKMYKIENQYYDAKEDNNLLIKIYFILQPGKPPKLEVIDQYNRVLNSSLENAPESNNLGYIPTKNLYNFRQNLSNMGCDKLLINYEDIEQKISILKKELIKLKSSNFNSLNIINYSKNLRQLRLDINNRFPTILNYISKDNEKNITPILDFYVSLEDLINRILVQLNRRIPRNINFSGEQKLSINNIYIDLLLFLGKSYSLTQNMSLNYLFNSEKICSNNVKSFKEHLHNISRLSCTQVKQKKYFNLFSNYSRKENKEFYKIEAYLWGYGRILLWYLNFEEADNCLNYQKNFSDIINYCLTLNYEENKNKSYFQNALLCLVYLLTLREINPEFVAENSYNYQLAKQLVNKLENYQIRSKLVSIKDNLSLNELFAQLLDGKATGDYIPKLEGVD